MRHLILSIFAIAIAGVAAVAATTAIAERAAAHRSGRRRIATTAQPGQPLAPDRKSPMRRRRKAPGAPAAPRPRAPSPRAPKRLPPSPPAEGEKPESPTRIPTRASRPKICRPICNTTRMPASVSRRTPDYYYSCTASTSTTTRCPSPAMASCLPLSRWRWRRSTRGRRASGARRWRLARGRPDEVSLTHWRELATQRPTRRATSRSKCTRTCARCGDRPHRSRGCRARGSGCERVGSLRGALSAAGVDTRDFLDAATLTAAARRRSQPLRVARCGLAFGHRDARGRRRRMHLRRSLRQRARQPARRLRFVAHRGGRRAW